MVDISHAGDYAESVAIRAAREGNAEIVGVEAREHISVGFMEVHTSKRPFTLVRVTKAFEYGPIWIDGGYIWVEGDLTLPPSPQDIEWDNQADPVQLGMLFSILKRPSVSVVAEDDGEVIITDRQYLKARLPLSFLREWVPALLQAEDPRIESVRPENLAELSEYLQGGNQ